MKYAWIENYRVKDIAPGDPFKFYHPDVAKFYDTEVPDNAEIGDMWDGELVKQPIQVFTQPPPLPRQWTEIDFRNAMTLAEKTKWDNDTAPEIKTVKNELPKEQTGAQELVDFLVATNVISQDTATKIMI